MKKKIIISLTALLVLTTLIISVKEKEENKLTLNETNNMISYTLDGNKTSTKPTKESGYIANTINCENRTNLVWDNTNWEAEIIASETTDVCNIDFTTNASTEGYRITVNTNIEDSIDSLSKTTVNGGKIIFYPKGGNEITGISGCSGVIEKGNLVITNITSNQTCNITVKTTLYGKILADHKTIKTRTKPNFDTAIGGTQRNTDYDTIGVIYKESTYRETPESTGSSNNNKNVYYFAGNPQDNWIEFGGYYWRIIRTNEDGSIRLLYHGTTPTETKTVTQSSSSFNLNYNNTISVGYMYGTEGSIENNRTNTTDSNVKKSLVDPWYKTNIYDKNYDKYVSKTAIYCNDRASGEYASSGAMYYAAYNRIKKTSQVQPSYQCGQATGGYYNTSESWNTLNGPFISSPASVADKFSASTQSGGNGKLTYPIALITADEIIFAGGARENSPNVYYGLNSNNQSIQAYWSWTMTPAYFNNNYSGYQIGMVYGLTQGQLIEIALYRMDYINYIRPVLSLKSCVSWVSGNGTAESPYKVSVDGACSIAVN